jgi:hypothetical protein
MFEFCLKDAFRPTDDELWDQTLRERDLYHEWADKLANAIAEHFNTYIGEHSNQNCPWAEALEVIERAHPATDGAKLADAAPAEKPIAWTDVVSAIRAVDAEAARRGEMFPQMADEHREDRRATRRTVEMIEWYAKHGGAVAEKLPGWPKITYPAADVATDAARDAIATAYGYLWHVNAAHDAPPEAEVLSITPEQAAYEARKVLRDLLTHEQRGKGINAVRAAMSAAKPQGEKGGAS